MNKRVVVVMSCAALVGCAVMGYWWWSRAPKLNLSESLAQVDAHFEQRNLESALELLERLLVEYPDHAAVLLRRGRISAAQNEFAEALRYFQQIPDESAFAAEAWYYRGMCLEYQRLMRRAEAAWHRSLKLNPASVGSLEKLADLYACQLRSRELEAALRQVLSVRPWDLKEMVLHITRGESWGFPPDRIETLHEYLAADPEDLESSLALARTYVDIEQPAEALRVLEETAPADRTYALTATAHLSQGDREGARKAFEQANPASDDDELFRARARLAVAEGQPEAAIKLLGQINPNQLKRSDHLLFGDALRLANRPDDADTHHAQAQMLETLVNRSMLTLITNHPQELSSGLMEVARILAKLERWTEAALATEQLLNRDPNNSSAATAYRQYIDKIQESGDDPKVARLRHPAGSPSGAAGSGQPSRPLFVDIHETAGIRFTYETGRSGRKYILESVGGGVAVIDYDDDGWPDLFFPQGRMLPLKPSPQAPLDKLFRNRLGASFEEIPASISGLDGAGYGLGATTGDYDSDGDTDLIVSNFGRNRFYRNNGDGTFTDDSDAVGLRGEAFSSSLALADLDRDGDLDLYVVNYVVDALKTCKGEDGRPVSCGPEQIGAEQDRLYLNLGDGKLSDVTEQTGIVAKGGKGLGIVVSDLDNDFWPDIYVANDTTANFLFRNKTSAGSPSGLRFEEVGMRSGSGVNATGQAEAGMGIACGDFDGDNQRDIYVTNFQGETNTVYLNQQDMIFEDATNRMPGLSAPSVAMLGFGVQPIDADLDGNLDLFVTNGHVDSNSFLSTPEKMPPQFFYNHGKARFEELSLVSGSFFTEKFVGRGVAWLDWNRDGRPDLVTSHQHDPAALLQNDSPQPGYWIAIDCVGTRSNRSGIGTSITIATRLSKRSYELIGGSGFLAANQNTILVGVGDSEIIGELKIHWASGWEDRWSELGTNRAYRVVEGTANSAARLVDITLSKQ